MLSILLSILLCILKVIGILLLIILLLLLLILVVPIRYQFEGSYVTGEDPFGKVSVTWFLFLLRARAGYIEKTLQYEVKILGFSLLSSNPKATKKKEKSANKKSATKKPETVQSEEKKPETVSSYNNEKDKHGGKGSDESAALEDLSEKKITEDITQKDVLKDQNKKITSKEEHKEDSSKKNTSKKVKKEDSSKKNTSKKAKKEDSSKKNTSENETKETPGRLEKIRDKFGQLQDFVDEYQIFSLIETARTAIVKTLRHVLPRRLSGWIHFGLDDPSVTGKITAIAAMFYPVYGRTFTLEPDFQKACIEGRGYGKGRVRLGFFLWLVIWLLMKKEIRKIIGFILG